MKSYNLTKRILGSILAILLSTTSCKKQDAFLAAIPNQSLKVPQSLNDLQLILQDDRVFNNSDPGLGLANSEDYYVTDAFFLSMNFVSQNEYVWAKNPYPNTDVDGWIGPYQAIYYANVVLDNLSKFDQESLNQAGAIKGAALFFRSWAFFNLLQTFSLPYDSRSSNQDLGILLRLSSDLNKKYPRSTIQQCYDQIIQDVSTSLNLLPSTTINSTLPNKTAANAFLARIYLSMSDYNNAFKYANACLTINSSITDFNGLNLTKRPISPTPLTEEIFRSDAQFTGPIGTTSARIVTPSFYATYDANDLRKKVFFYTLSGNIVLFGSYDVKKNGLFTGLATDEMYLIRAECYARMGNTSAAMTDLNNLLVKRWVTGTFTPYTAINANDALQKILVERRKELICRGLRWLDLRRLNKDPQFAVTLTRTVNGQTYTLPPNDPRYAMPIPDNEIQLSGIPQNQR